eukprot:gene14558-14681_t
MSSHNALSLHIPEPRRRPGEAPDFSGLALSGAGEVGRPAVDAPAETMRDMAFQLIRVLDDQGTARGPWTPDLKAEAKIDGLKAMILTRAFDERMYRAQRQGKTSFYMKCTGEEAIACAQARVLRREDMGFPTYRQQGLLIARGYPLVDMMNQIYSNAADPIKGLAGSGNATFAAKGLGYGLPSIRVDGNDYLAVHAATEWAAARARANLGATVIEHFTYRAAQHSTSDDPSRYRPGDEAALWPLGDPILRLKTHLVVEGLWSEADHVAAEADAQEKVRAAARDAEAIGVLGQSVVSTPTGV